MEVWLHKVLLDKLLSLLALVEIGQQVAIQSRAGVGPALLLIKGQHLISDPLEDCLVAYRAVGSLDKL